jgi:hypothetical protein
MRGKQCKCRSFDAKSSLSQRQLRLVPKVGQRGQLKLQQDTRKKDFTKLTIRYKRIASQYFNNGIRYNEIKQLSTQVRMQRMNKRYNNIQLTKKETSTN